MNDIVDKYD